MNDRTASVATIAPWTIKAFSVEARRDIVAAAAGQKMEVGAFVERVWRSYLADGSPVQVEPAIVAGFNATPESLAALATLAQATRDMAAAAGVSPPASLAKSLLALTAAQVRSARGLQPRTKALPALPAPEAPADAEYQEPPLKSSDHQAAARQRWAANGRS